MSEEFFKIRNLKKAFGKHLVLAGINLDVQKGEVLGIIGTSGSGKTTLLHSIIGFLKPDQGEVRILVEPTHRALGEATYKDVHTDIRAAQRVYGFASQAPSFYDTLTVSENLKYYGSLYNMPRNILETNRDILLHLMDLEPAKNLLAKNLSGGMERRLDIACALMHDPAVLILDEPTADLDPILRNHIYALIKKINSKNTTIILASHHLSDMERVCDRIAILKDGKLMAVGTLPQIRDHFADYQRAIVRVASGKHESMVSHMKRKHSKLIEKDHITSEGAIFLTKYPEEFSKAIAEEVNSSNEKLESLHISKPSLDDIFIAIMEGKNEFVEKGARTTPLRSDMDESEEERKVQRDEEKKEHKVVEKKEEEKKKPVVEKKEEPKKKPLPPPPKKKEPEKKKPLPPPPKKKEQAKKKPLPPPPKKKTPPPPKKKEQAKKKEGSRIDWSLDEAEDDLNDIVKELKGGSS